MRSKYIYLVIAGQPSCCPDFDILSAHTVKYEAHDWIVKHGYDVRDACLFRMRAGDEPREGEYIEWEDDLFGADHFNKAASEVADWPDWKRGVLGG